MKCIVTDYVEQDLEWERGEYEKAGIDFTPLQMRRSAEEELSAAVRDAEILVVDQAKITRSVLEAASRCVLVIRHGDGYDNVDLNTATDLGIAVANEPGYWFEEVAEQTVMLLLAVWLKLPAQMAVAAHPKRGEGMAWDIHRLFPIRRFAGSTVGIVGFGKIGRAVAKRVTALGARVIVHDSFLESREIISAGYQPVSMEQLLSESDAITLHVPAGPEGKPVLGETELAMIKPGSIVVNTARGTVMDTDALTTALAAGRLGGAALDVTAPEPLPPGHPLLQREDVIITPHLGWYSDDAMWTMRRGIVKDVLAVRGGKLPDSVVNRSVLESSALRITAKGLRSW